MSAPPLFSDSFRLEGTVLDGRFRVEGRVAEGGFGVVYRAIQITLDRPVAVKVLKTPAGMSQSASTEFHARFATEAKTIARMRHPNIVEVHDFGVSRMPSGETAPWMALEWLHGTTLEGYLTARRGSGGQSPSEVLTLLRPVLQAIAYAHREGVAHRDIKPANIMVVSTESKGTATTLHPAPRPILRVLDFGIAKVMTGDDAPGSGQTRTAGPSPFSPPYAAPEQIARGRTGPWTDVHALGLILTELLLDQPPYLGQDRQLFEEAMLPTRPTPAVRGRDVGPWESVIAKALAFSPGARWKDAGALLLALESTVDAATSSASADAGAPGLLVSVPGGTIPLPGGAVGSSARDARDVGVGGAAPARPTGAERRRQRGVLWVAGGILAGLAVASGLRVSSSHGRAALEAQTKRRSTPTSPASSAAVIDPADAQQLRLGSSPTATRVSGPRQVAPQPDRATAPSGIADGSETAGVRTPPPFAPQASGSAGGGDQKRNARKSGGAAAVHGATSGAPRHATSLLDLASDRK